MIGTWERSPDLPVHVQDGDARQHDVEEPEFRLDVLGAGERLLTVPGRDDAEAFPCQADGQRLDVGLLVVHEPPLGSVTDFVPLGRSCCDTAVTAESIPDVREVDEGLTLGQYGASRIPNCVNMLSSSPTCQRSSKRP